MLYNVCTFWYIFIQVSALSGTYFGFGICNLKLFASKNRLSIVPSLQIMYIYVPVPSPDGHGCIAGLKMNSKLQICSNTSSSSASVQHQCSSNAVTQPLAQQEHSSAAIAQQQHISAATQASAPQHSSAATARQKSTNSAATEAAAQQTPQRCSDSAAAATAHRHIPQGGDSAATAEQQRQHTTTFHREGAAFQFGAGTYI